MDGPRTLLRLDANGNVLYGWQTGRRLLSITKSFRFKNRIWLLVYWEGYELLEAVPFDLLPRKYHAAAIDFMKKNVMH